MVRINKDEEQKLDQLIQERTLKLQKLQAEIAEIDAVTREIDADMQEMGNHEAYKKFAFFNIREIRNVMMSPAATTKVEYKSTNHTDAHDAINLRYS